MKRLLFMRCLILLLCMTFNFSFADGLTSVKTVRDVVLEFCQADFDGIQDARTALVKFTPERNEMEKGKDPELVGKVIALESDPLIVVNSYKILAITENTNSAIATVVYERVAKTFGEGLLERKIIADHIDNDVQMLNLVNADGHWLILDPPLPRVSRKALIDYYSNFTGNMEKWIHEEKISSAQRQTYQVMVYTVSTLKSLE